jgi:hypothetical protein
MTKLACVLGGMMMLVGACGGRQPHMHAALDDLRSAQRELEEASHDKGGHRVKALELIRQAEEEVRAGMEVGAMNEGQ